MHKPLAIIVAGGTGGHIFPGLSVAESLQGRGWDVKWAGNPSAMEGRLVPKHGIELCPLVFSGFRGKGLLDQLLIPLKLLRAFWSSIGILRKNRPAVVLGMGGYVAFPLGMMASLLNIPLVIHEQNSIAGLTNKVLAKIADRVLVAFPGALDKAPWVGNPIRQDLASLPAPQDRYAQRQGPLNLLVVGGSLGAAALNELVPKALALLPEDQRPTVTHQSGERHLDQLKAHYAEAGVKGECVAFIENMSERMAKADVMICRSGAMTVAEVAAVGVAALMVPFPHAVDDHQTTNADFLVKGGAGWIRQQKDLSATWVADWLKGLSRHQCMEVASRARDLAKPLAASEVADHMEQVRQKQ